MQGIKSLLIQKLVKRLSLKGYEIIYILYYVCHQLETHYELDADSSHHWSIAVPLIGSLHGQIKHY